MSTSFSLGQTVMTRGAQDTLDAPSVYDAIGRHSRGDWGDVSSDDWKENDWAVQHGERILSCFRDANGVKFWIITERDRSVTTVLLPDEY